MENGTAMRARPIDANYRLLVVLFRIADGGSPYRRALVHKRHAVDRVMMIPREIARRHLMSAVAIAAAAGIVIADELRVQNAPVP
jgi:hypothetical protein